MLLRSIRARLTLWYTGILTVTFLLLVGIGYGLLSYSLSHEVDAALRGVAQALSQRPHEAGNSFFPREIDEIFRRFFGSSPWNRYFEMFDPLGRRLRQPPPSGAESLPLSEKALENASKGLSTFETVEGLGEHPVRILTLPVVEAGRVARLVQVGMSLEGSHVTRRRYLLIMSAVLPFGLLLAGGGGWLLARRVLSPVDRMAETARVISAERLSGRIEETGTGDELDRLANTLNSMLERLDASFQQIRQFSGDASHELQTPLTILKGELEVALRSRRSPEEYQRVLNSALEEINRIEHLVEGLLLLARSEAGVLKMDHRAVNLVHLIEEVCDQGKLLAREKNIDLVIGNLNDLELRGDHERLRRLLLNLVDNAIKYTPSGGQVTVSVDREDDTACIRVSDTGIGLPEEDRERIFHRFYRGTEARSLVEAGAGLGLCIARSIAEAHGGRVRVESTPSIGSAFSVLLPID
jgi:heavy metal sensor kinase